MTKIEMESSRLKKIIKYADLITGSDKNEPGMRLYYDEGLKVYATDGGIQTHFRIKTECDEFMGVYELHIPTLKLFLDRGYDEIPVVLHLNEKEVTFRFENEMLSLFQPGTVTVPEIPVFRTLGNAEFSSFMNGLDFASIIMPENDYIYFFVRDGLLYVITIHDDFFTLYNSKEFFDDLEVKVPYHNIRHFVKSLSLIKNKDLKIGINSEEIRMAFQTSGIITHVCTEFNSHEESAYLLNTINLYEMLEPLGVIEFNSFKNILAKTSRISKNGNIELEILDEELKISVRRKNLYYSSSEKMKEISNGKTTDIIYSIHPGKIKSAIGKIESEDIHIFAYHDFIGFGNSEKGKIIVIKGKILKRGWQDVRLERTAE